MATNNISKLYKYWKENNYQLALAPRFELALKFICHGKEVSNAREKKNNRRQLCSKENCYLL